MTCVPHMLMFNLHRYMFFFSSMKELTNKKAANLIGPRIDNALHQKTKQN